MSILADPGTPANPQNPFTLFLIPYLNKKIKLYKKKGRSGFCGFYEYCGLAKYYDKI